MMNIFQSIAGVMNEIGAVGKNDKNQQQGFKYRGIDAVMNALSPALQKYKVFIVPEVIDQERDERTNKQGTTLLYARLKVKYTFYAEDGTNVSAVVIGEGMDTGDKASNKAMSIAFKYAAFQTFCIPTEEMMDDPDKDYHEVNPKENKKAQAFTPAQPSTITAVQVKALEARCKNEGVALQVIFDLYKVTKLEELTLIKYTNINDNWDKIVEKAKT